MQRMLAIARPIICELSGFDLLELNKWPVSELTIAYYAIIFYQIIEGI